MSSNWAIKGPEAQRRKGWIGKYFEAITPKWTSFSYIDHTRVIPIFSYLTHTKELACNVCGGVIYFYELELSEEANSVISSASIESCKKIEMSAGDGAFSGIITSSLEGFYGVMFYTETSHESHPGNIVVTPKGYALASGENSITFSSKQSSFVFYKVYYVEEDELSYQHCDIRIIDARGEIYKKCYVYTEASNSNVDGFFNNLKTLFLPSELKMYGCDAASISFMTFADSGSGLTYDAAQTYFARITSGALSRDSIHSTDQGNIIVGYNSSSGAYRSALCSSPPSEVTPTVVEGKFLGYVANSIHMVGVFSNPDRIVVFGDEDLTSAPKAVYSITRSGVDGSIKCYDLYANTLVLGVSFGSLHTVLEYDITTPSSPILLRAANISAEFASGPTSIVARASGNHIAISGSSKIHNCCSMQNATDISTTQTSLTITADWAGMFTLTNYTSSITVSTDSVFYNVSFTALTDDLQVGDSFITV